MTTETALITDVGEAAAIAADGSGLDLKITHVAIGAAAYTPATNMTALVDLREVAPVLVGAKQGAQVTLTATFRASLYAGAAYGVGEIGFFAGNPTSGGILVAVISAPGRAAPARGGANITNYSPTFVLAFSGVPTGSVGVTFDPDAGAGLVALSAHVAASDPHTQYLKESGGVLTGALALFGNATNPLEAVPLQQLTAAFGGNFNANGFLSLPSGHILRWGTSSVAINGEVVSTIAFPDPFPTACLWAMVMGYDPSALAQALDDAWIETAGWDADGVKARLKWVSGGNAIVRGVTYLAIGH